MTAKKMLASSLCIGAMWSVGSHPRNRAVPVMAYPVWSAWRGLRGSFYLFANAATVKEEDELTSEVHSACAAASRP